MHLLQGLSFEYDSIIANVNSHRAPLDIEEVLAFLLNQEMRTVSAITPLHLSANLGNKNTTTQDKDHQFNQGGSNQSYRGGPQCGHDRGKGR